MWIWESKAFWTACSLGRRRCPGMPGTTVVEIMFYGAHLSFARWALFDASGIAGLQTVQRQTGGMYIWSKEPI